MIPISKIYKYYPKLKELLRNISEKVKVPFVFLITAPLAFYS